jgi:hypothetical protein
MRRKFAGYVVGVAPAAQMEGLRPSRPPLKLISVGKSGAAFTVKFHKEHLGCVGSSAAQMEGLRPSRPPLKLISVGKCGAAFTVKFHKEHLGCMGSPAEQMVRLCLSIPPPKFDLRGRCSLPSDFSKNGLYVRLLPQMHQFCRSVKISSKV